MKVYLPPNILDECPSPQSLIDHVGSAPFVIKLPNNDRNEKVRQTNPRIKKRGTPLHYHLHNFIMWRVPSDYYLVRKPGFSVQDGEVVSKKSRRAAVTAEGRNFRFIN